jgi:tRNA A64-2'-O-ribosylphosphate transferase
MMCLLWGESSRQVPDSWIFFQPSLKRQSLTLETAVPIWCCVLNHVLFPDDAEKHVLYTPPNAVSASEHAQIGSRIPEFVDLFKSLDVKFDALRRLRKPLRPMWVTPESQLVATEVVFDDFHPIICCTSSHRVTGGEMSEGGYIQGAGDDTENWALGLTPPVFWAHESDFLSTPEVDLPELITSLVASQSATMAGPAPRQVAPCLFVGTLPKEVSLKFTCTINLLPDVTDSSSWVKSPSCMEVGIGKHKLASRNLRTALPQICQFIEAYITTHDQTSIEDSRIIISCETGKDISIGVALALLCQVFDSHGNLHALGTRQDISKAIIKVKLGRLMTEFPEANPSRATLQSVNSFLMG